MKRKILIPFLIAIMSIAMALGLSACGSCSGDTSDGITLNQTSITIEAGSTGSILATYDGDEDLTFTIADTSVATVSTLAKTALVKGVAAGTTTLTAAAGEYTATCEIIVTAAVTYTIYNNGTAITSLDIPREGDVTLTATGSDGSTASYWFSSDENVATVSNGTVTAVSIGTATIYAGKDSSHCAELAVTVTAKDGGVAYTLTTDSATDTWYYWTEWAEITTKTYESGDITLTFTNNAGNWYNIQLFYVNSELEVGKAYALQFNVNTTVGGRITVNGMVFTLEAGDTTIYAPYYESTDGTSASIQLGVQKGTIIDIGAATMVFSDFDWKPIEAETLAPPSFTVSSSGVITITDTNDSTKVGSYKLYLYDASGNLAGAVDVENGMNIDDLDTSAIAKGTYTAYLRALGFSSVYTDSANSTSSTTITVTTDASYKLTFNTESDAVTTPGTWFYWCEYWVDISDNTYADGVVSLTFGNNAGNWYDTQLFYKSTGLTAGQAYKLTFTLNSTNAGTITINGSIVDIIAGENNIEVSYTESSSGASIAITFGTSTLGANPSSATVTLSNFNWEETTIELDSINNGGEGDATAHSGYWYYWNDLNYVSSYTEVSDASYEDGTLSITYTVTPWDGQSAPFYALQLFYENGNLTAGETYTVTLTITSTVAGSITVNGTVVELEANVAKEVTVSFTEASKTASISIQMGVGGDEGATVSVISGATITVSGVTFKDASGNVIDNGEGADTNTSGDSGSGDTTEYEVSGDAIYPSYANTLKNEGENAANDTWLYWYVQDTSWNCGTVVTMSTATLENEVLTLTYTGGSETYSVQVFYTNTSLTNGKTYRLTCNVYASVACNVIVNGKNYTLSAGDNAIEVDFTLGEISAFDMQLAGTSTETTVKISDVAWYSLVAISDSDATEYEISGDAIYPSYANTLKNEGENAANDTWLYWYVQDTSWNCGTVVTMSTATLENEVLTLTYTGGNATFSVQVFYTNTSLTTGNTYRLTCTVNASVACSVTINGKDYTLSAGDNAIEVDFTLGEISAFDMQLAGTSTETTVSISNVAWYNVVAVS